METRPELSEFDPVASEAKGATPRDCTADNQPISQRPGLTVITGSSLTLGFPVSDNVPDAWRTAIAKLARWLDMTIEQVPQRPVSGLRHVTAWAAAARSATSAPAAPMFAPWQGWSPVGLQQPGDAALPRASWVGSYLQDPGSGKTSRSAAIDVQLLSPLPSACTREDADDAPLPRADVLEAMIDAARGQGRDKIAIVTDARRRNAMIRQMLLLGRSVLRDAPGIDVMTIEDTLCELVRHPARWDAIVILPDLRSLVFALLTEITGNKSPWPMVWHHRTATMIASETLQGSASSLPLHAPLLIGTLALAADQAGFSLAAHRLAQGAARLWDRGIVTAAHGSTAPYVTEVSDEEFIDQLCRGVERSQRAVPRWRALTTEVPPLGQRRPARLRVVVSN